ncbi:MAG: hypothetical protein ACRDKH_01545, partial [Solirubrobacterales bacterium]
VWVARSGREVVRLDPETGGVDGEPAEVAGAFDVAAGEGSAWALGEAGTLVRIDPDGGDAGDDTSKVSGALDVAAGLGYVWVTTGDGRVLRFDPDSGRRVGPPIRIGRRPRAIAIGADSVWVAAARDGAVYRIVP